MPACCQFLTRLRLLSVAPFFIFLLWVLLGIAYEIYALHYDKAVSSPTSAGLGAAPGSSPAQIEAANSSDGRGLNAAVAPPSSRPIRPELLAAIENESSCSMAPMSVRGGTAPERWMKVQGKMRAVGRVRLLAVPHSDAPGPPGPEDPKQRLVDTPVDVEMQPQAGMAAEQGGDAA